MTQLAYIPAQPLAGEHSLAPRPRTLQDTGLDLHFVTELVAKHLYKGGVLTLSQLAERLALAGSILETVLNFLRKEARIEVLGGAGSDVNLRYALTDRGRSWALEALLKSGYVGPAPVPLASYTEVVRAQSVHRQVVTKTAIRETFAGVVIRESLLDQLGPALHSGRAIFIYGAPGTGKTYVSQRLAKLLGEAVLIPHAIAIEETVVQVFDPVLHQPLPGSSPASSLMLENGHDPRFVLCRRPAVITGGELTMDMLELQYDEAHKLYRAPLQLKATNGLYLLDDLGRQRITPVELLNRWIVPMETGLDYLSLGSGQRFPVLFDVVLVFSTNLNPLDLADEAFLRRLGYKIRFDYLDTREYEAIWRQVCEQQGIVYKADMLAYVLEHFYSRDRAPLLPCHPRDLLGLVADHCRYHGKPVEVTPESIAAAWESYFIKL